MEVLMLIWKQFARFQRNITSYNWILVKIRQILVKVKINQSEIQDEDQISSQYQAEC